ncbi:hypothetical protein [Sandaracinus amylolyticus]|uniref:hypothetical protein n=1 Tax=Sandaracinus amylolyticus TaxID=927083 RepID=UPI001F26A7F0|nr:hypothetical protein [Sandaracinus amylolyticus]
MTDSSQQTEQERDLAELQVRGTTKAAAAVGGMSGAIAVLTGLQFTTSASFHEPLYNVVPWALSGLGAVQLGLSLMVLRNHFPANVAASVLGVMVACVALGWAVLASTSGFVTAFTLLEVPLAGSAAILAPLALGATRRAWQAKKRLSDAGLELGF